MTSHPTGKNLFLVLIAMLEELLDNIYHRVVHQHSSWDTEEEGRVLTIGKHVGRELQHVGQDLLDDKSLLFWSGRLELRLDVTGSELVA